METLGGMTVNERLYACHLFAAWDEAVREKNRDGMVELLKQIELEKDAEQIADAILARAS
jgi:hypothetical protein